MRYLISILCLFWLLATPAAAQQQLPLYPDVVPNAIAAANLERNEANAEVDSLAFQVSEPTLTVFFPPEGRANGTLVIICPGGGYHTLLTKREGSDVARAFNEVGVTAVVLKYRLPDDRIMPEKHLGPVQDVQQAIRIAREHAPAWGIDPQRIGVMGFSAGGHLASTAGTHHAHVYIPNPSKTSLRPDFMLLINPVISFDESFGHVGSRDNLLSGQPSADLVHRFSNEHHVDANTPPTFLVHTSTDVVVPVENSLVFYQALRQHEIPAGLHVYATGEHGFLTSPPFDEWFGRCLFWMHEMGLMD